MSDALVQAHQIKVAPGKYVTMFRPIRPIQYVGVPYNSDPPFKALLHDGDEAVSYDTFEEADRVVRAYNVGPEECRSARWVSDVNAPGDGWGWEVIQPKEGRVYCLDPDREDFHSDI